MIFVKQSCLIKFKNYKIRYFKFYKFTHWSWYILHHFFILLPFWVSFSHSQSKFSKPSFRLTFFYCLMNMNQQYWQAYLIICKITQYLCQSKILKILLIFFPLQPPPMNFMQNSKSISTENSQKFLNFFFNSTKHLLCVLYASQCL